MRIRQYDRVKDEKFWSGPLYIVLKIDGSTALILPVDRVSYSPHWVSLDRLVKIKVN